MSRHPLRRSSNDPFKMRVIDKCNVKARNRKTQICGIRRFEPVHHTSLSPFGWQTKSLSLTPCTPHDIRAPTHELRCRGLVRTVSSADRQARNQVIRVSKRANSKGKKEGEAVSLPDDYRPSDDEPFMSDRQQLYFRLKLQAWRADILREAQETLAHLNQDSTQYADIADRATTETDRAVELRARDRQRKLISKIEAAIARIADGSYGYCEDTGEPIGLKRLDARPIATLSLEAQERHERRERVYRDD